MLSVVLIFTLLFLTGCWDSLELEEAAFVAGSAIDLADEMEEGKYLVTLTNQLVVPSGLGTASQGGSDSQAFRNISSSGESILAINRNLSKLTNRTISAEHLKVIVVAEDLAKEPYIFSVILDRFFREKEMRRGIKVVIASEGEAKELLNVQTEHENIPAQFINTLLENEVNAGSMEPVRIGDIHEHFLTSTSFTIPRLILVDGKEIIYEGVAVFQGNDKRLVGTLDTKETFGVNLIKGEDVQGGIPIEVDNDVAAIEVLNGSSKVKADIDGNHVVFHVDIEVEGNIGESFLTLNLAKEKNMQKFEAAFENAVKKRIDDTIKVAQDELQVDVFEFNNHLRKQHYKDWEKIKDNWDSGENYFSTSEIIVTVNASLVEAGTTEKGKERE